MKNSLRTKDGITLIALVVTIIVLIILAGVSISLVLGDNGIITKAKQGKESYSQAQAKEKLEMVLADLQADKATDEKYDQNEYINKRIEDNDMEIEENIVIVDGWQFEIDRNVPKIVNELPKLTEEEMLKPTIIKATPSVKGTEITISVQLRNEEGSKITYSIKNVETDQEIANTGEISELTYTFTTGIEEKKEYEITITATNNHGSSTTTVKNVLTDYMDYDVIRYMRKNSIKAKDMFAVENINIETTPGGEPGKLGFGAAHYAGSRFF